MGKNLNTQVWHLDSNGYTQTVSDLFTTTPPVYTHADHIDNTFNFCVNGINEQKKRAVLHMTNRADVTYTTENIDNLFIGNWIYDNRGNYSNRINRVLGNGVGGVSNFAIAPNSGSQPSGGNFKILCNFTYLTAVWAPRIGFAAKTALNTLAYYNLNDLDGESTASDAQEGETWWDYYTRKSSDFVVSIDCYNEQTYTVAGGFSSTSIYEGQTRAGIPSFAKVSWLKQPYYYGYSYGTDGCLIYNDNGQGRYSDLTFDVIFSYSLEYMEKKDEYDDIWKDSYNNPYDRHNILYGLKISKDIIMHIICSYGLPFSFSNATNISIGHADYALPEVKNNTTTGNWFRGADAITADTDNNRWANTKDIDNKPASGGGGGGGSYDDDPWSGVSFSGVGLGGGGAFARCYYMTSTELANLRTWMSGVGVPEGFNPMAQIIGLSQVPVALSGDAPETVQFINSSAVYDPGITSRIVDSNVSTQYSMGGPIKYSLGSVDIVRRMQERGEPYLDYSCQIELYLPLIGMFSLDTQAVMGRTIEAEAILDPISGTLAAYAWVSKDGHKLPVAYGSTTISVDLPVTAQQYSVSKAALKQANAQLGTSILSSVATLVAAAVGGGKAEGSNARVSGGASSMQGARGMNSYAQASSIAASQAAISQTGNIVGDFMQWGRTIKQLQYGNNTAISGSFGGSVAQWSYPFQAYVKINRPRYEKPGNYAHTQGVPCVQKKRIGDCTGFIQCIGVDVDNHIEGATDLERQAIQAALSSGIYAGGGGE